MEKRILLNGLPARPLTDRECSKILGAIIGGLMEFSNAENVRRAVFWWAQNLAPVEEGGSYAPEEPDND